MFHTAIVYSPINLISADYIRNLGLLYDRVILPLPDAIRSNKIEWLNNLSEGCEYTQLYLNQITSSFPEDCDFCKPLSIDDYPSLAMGSNIFRNEFFTYVNKNIGDDEWTDIVSNAIDFAQDILNFYIAQDIVDGTGGGTLVFPVKNRTGLQDKLFHQIAEVLKSEAVKFATHDFQLPRDPASYQKLFNLSKSLNSKYELMLEIENASREIVTSDIEVKDALRQQALRLATSYNRYIEDLERYGKHITVRRNKGTNTLYVARKLVRPKNHVQQIGNSLMKIQFNLDQYTSLYNQLLDESRIFCDSCNTDFRWQADLLTFRSDLDREFGRREKYREIEKPNFFEYILRLIRGS